MKERMRIWYEKLFSQSTVKPLDPGIYQYQAPADAQSPYRLHLRIEGQGEGILMINASTVLHLNQTAAEYAYHLVNNTPADEVARLVAQRYSVSEAQAKSDYQELVERINTLITTQDLDPVTFLDFERMDPYSSELIAPYRLDCAVTYRVIAEKTEGIAPVERVKRELTSDEWKTILERAWHAGIPQVIFTGGEPTLRPDLPELVEYAEKLGQVTGLLTNGLRLSEPQYLHHLLNAGLDHIMLILDAGDEQSWEALRDTLAEDIFVTVHLTIHDAMKTTSQALLERLQNMGVRSISLSTPLPSLQPELLKARDEAAALNLDLVWDLPVPYSSMHPLAAELEDSENTIQGAGRAWLYVEPDGDVLPGQGSKTVLGNLLADGWQVVWDQAKSLH